MREAALPGVVKHRVKGRQAVERRLRGVQLALVRYGQHRATHPEDLRWAQRAFDAIALLLSEPPAAAGVAPLRRAPTPATPNTSDGPRVPAAR